MTDVRIIAVSFSGGRQLENISYVWTAGGATTARRVIEDIWFGRCSYYTSSPSGRVAVLATPAKGPNLLDRALGRHVVGHLQSQTNGRNSDNLLGLPRLPSPDRARRSLQLQSQQDNEMTSV